MKIASPWDNLILLADAIDDSSGHYIKLEPREKDGWWVSVKQPGCPALHCVGGETPEIGMRELERHLIKRARAELERRKEASARIDSVLKSCNGRRTRSDLQRGVQGLL